MQVDRISFFNDASKLSFEMKVNHAKQEVVNNIQNIVKQVLENNEFGNTTARGNPDEVIAQAKARFEQFVATRITEEKLKELDELSERVKNVVSLLANRSKAELTAGPMRSFLGMMGALTSNTTVDNFFLTQSLSPGRRLAGQLEETFTESVLDQLLNQ